MADVRNHKNRSLPYGALLTKIFEHFRVNFREQRDQHIGEGFTTYMISRGITFDLTGDVENEEVVGNENQQLMEIDTSGNTEDIRPSITRRPSCMVLRILWVFEHYDGLNRAASKAACEVF